ERRRQQIPRVLVVFDDEDRLAHEAGIDRARRHLGVRHVSSAVARRRLGTSFAPSRYSYRFGPVFLRIRPGAIVRAGRPRHTMGSLFPPASVKPARRAAATTLARRPPP